MLHKFHKLKLVRRNLRWLLSGIPLRYKLSYYPALIVSFIDMVTIGERRIKYLGNTFYFDGLVVPLTLLLFPHEIEKMILDHTDSKVNSLLDIGGNLGQFTATFYKIAKPKNVDVLEPNPLIFKLLQQNLKNLRGVRAFNVGVGPTKKQTLYFEEGRSSEGSVLQNDEVVDNVSKVNITLTNKVSELTNKKYYDLIKIDVEGYEYEVINNIADLRCKYLFIELSGDGRSKTVYHSTLFNAIRSKLGEFEIVFSYFTTSKSASIEMLLRFK